MKKLIMFSVLLTGVAGIAAWQLYLGNHDATGETRSVELSDGQPATQKINNQEVVEDVSQADSVAETDQEQQIVVEPTLNSDEATDEMNKYVSSARPEKIMEYYAQLRTARAELVQNQMNAERQDTNWSDEVNSRFEFMRGISPALSDLKLVSTDCRQTICALHMQLAAGEYKKYAPYLQNIGVVMGSDAFVHHDAGPDETVIYLARAEMSLPQLDLAK